MHGTFAQQECDRTTRANHLSEIHRRRNRRRARGKVQECILQQDGMHGIQQPKIPDANKEANGQTRVAI